MQNRITINERGVITIPARMREAFGLKGNDELIIEDTRDGLLIRPAFSVPIEVYTEDRIAEFAADEDAVGKLLPPPTDPSGPPGSPGSGNTLGASDRGIDHAGE